MSKSLCLNMIVKNESHIIVHTLSKLCLKIKFDYYVICDTGSEDNTIDLIKNFFKDRIPGEIYIHEWKDFGYNRSLALQLAYKKTDYVLVFDADDYIDGDFILPDLTLDSYMLKFGNADITYERTCLVKNDIIWKYIGILHEYISTENKITTGKIVGNYFVVSGRTSSRNKDSQKYIKDAEILEKGYHESLKNGDGLSNRYVYYCANSYLDGGMKDKAIEWYLLTLKSNGWFDERYNACLKLYELTNKEEYLVQSFHYNPRRIEGIYYLIRHYTCIEMYSIAMGYYNFIKNFYENEYLSYDISKFLFANVMDYTFYLPYYMIIVCEKLKDYSTGLKMYEIIFEKMTTGGQWWSNNLLFNLQFYDHTRLKKLNEYIQFLEKSGIKINYDLEYLKNFSKPKKYTFDILFYTGFAENSWNCTYSLNNALGGSEKAVIYLSRLFPKEMKIVISGDVDDEVIDNIHYINRFKLNNNYEFKTIIVSRYVSFFTMYPYLLDNNIIILMAHDTHFMNNVQSCNKSANEIISKYKDKINFIVYLTEWQKSHYEDITHPECKYIKSTIINNGIQLDLFKFKFSKKPNSFVYTSGSFRGLLRLLQLWPSILNKIPDATLSICSYENFPKNNDEDFMMNEIIKKYPMSIKHLGKLKTDDLYYLMNISEYWLYPCSFNETSCITALEMLMSEVICLYYPIAGLTYTLGNYGIQIKEGNEIEKIIEITEEDKNRLKKNGKEYAKTCSWENRFVEWNKLIKKKKKILFYGRYIFPKIILDDYFNSLKTVYEIDYTTEIKKSDYTYYDELIYVHETYDRSILDKFKEINYLNTEPLNLDCRLLYIKQNVCIFPEMKIYDYSIANIEIMKKNGIKNKMIYFPYLLNKEENIFLKQQKEINEKENTKNFDYGIICSAGLITNQLFLLNPPRRKQVVEHLIKEGFTVNIISGFGKERDIALSKCKIILNIHGQIDKTPSNIFEHLRCNRLLDAGYTILSEESYCMDPSFSKYKNLKCIKFDDFFKITKEKQFKEFKIIDCFTFYNEIDMLMYRLETLYEFVDYFILVEATLTHIGKPKEMYYSKEIFKKYSDKIIHIVVDDFPFDEHKINYSKNEQWKNEKFQRNCIIRGLYQLDLNYNDIIIISDVDEIINPEIINSIRIGVITINNVCQFEQDFYYYNIECKMDHLWYFSKAFRYGWFLINDYTIDDIRMKMWETISNGGWHLSYFGTPSFISNKIKNFAHQEFNLDTFTKEEAIRERIKNNLDIYDRNIQIIKLNVKLNKHLPPNYNLVYCFIHSCNLGKLNRLEHLMDKLKTCGINFKSIFINNIGKPIENTFEKPFENVENYSKNPLLFEIPTINKIIKFSKENPYDNIIYLHTKGVAHADDYHELNDWINLMLHFLIKKSNKELLNKYDCIGCNYKNDPLPHFSGNFWWANCKYLLTLPEISEINVNKNDAEYNLFKNNPDYFSLHNSNVNHYHERYQNFYQFDL
jgi:beta-1,4-mannosyl-glycoprotein beta-1,4-N-acetylglucosaminyltransferase